MNSNDQNKDELRQSLLELHYDLLDQDEAQKLRQRISTDPQVAAEWSETRKLADKLAEAAQIPRSASIPSSTASEQLPSATPIPSTIKAKPIWFGPTLIGAIAASIGMLILGSLYVKRLPETPMVPVRIEAKVTPVMTAGTDHQYNIVTKKLDTVGTSIGGFSVTPASLSFAVLAKGTILFSGVTDTDASGTGKIVLPSDIVIPENAKLSITATSDKSNVSSATIEVPLEPTRCLTYLTTDRPVYRPGETIYFRSLTLDRRSFRSIVDVPIRYEILGSNGTPIQTLATEGVTDRGVGNGALTIPSTISGGPYTLIAKSLDGFFPDERCDFQVRPYRVPRFNTQLDFHRRSYGPGETVEADFHATKAEGGPVANAKVRVNATLDDRVIHSVRTTTNNNGSCKIAFSLPSHIARAAGKLLVVVEDSGTQEAKTKTIPIQLGRIEIDFYPEGGYLVDGLLNRVYFSARDSLGKPIHFAGEIQTHQNERVTTIETIRDGMGRFEFVPERGKRYSLVVTTPVGITHSPKLPAVVRAFPVLDTGSGVFDIDEAITMNIRTQTERRVIIRAVCRGQLVGEKQVRLGIGENSLSLPIRDDTAGVVRVTVFDVTMVPAQPLVERLVFRRQSKRLHIEIESSSPTDASPGEPLRITLQVRDETGEPTPAVLGAAVVDNASLRLRENERPNMQTHFLLTSEVQKPEDLEYANFYLDESAEAATAVDLLLGTQGWRRFVSGSNNQPNVDFRKQLVRLIQLDGSDAETKPRSFESPNEPSHEWSLYQEQVIIAWRTFTSQTRFLLATIFILWLVALVIRIRRRPQKKIAIWLLVASTSLATVGCGSPENATVQMDNSPTLDRDAMERSAAANPDVGSQAGSSEAIEVAELLLQASHFDELESVRSRLLRTTSEPTPERTLTKTELQKLFASRGLDVESFADQLMNELRFPVREYAHHYQSGDDETQTDSAETLFWHPLLITNSDGRVTIDFELPDSTTTFRVDVNAHTIDGRIGSASGEVVSRRTDPDQR
ncbi:MG2 domain protein [Planctomycetes bacterium CA13]|uniref:MG2 domain protein n=1 Tax=Novipirellula herctigrandis TaxID=2527986 RepID=A0A5C5Z532_9BACT|nr:MG2 domain protein [Planctomycetes bacterium CA13]